MIKKTLSQIALLILLLVSIASCSKEEVAPNQPETSTTINAKYNYSSEELQVLTLINNYRTSKGLKTLEKVDYISTVCENHDNYMISIGEVTHNFFQNRYELLVANLGAKSVSENLAYNYSTPQGVVNAWLASEGHRTNIEGNFTHFGLAIRENTEGKKYYTNLFMLK